MISATQALKRLQEGNLRFAANISTARNAHEANERVAEQEPIAIILGCSDARVPAEIIFDQGLGDLFVIRVAGNIVSPSQIGSIEFAAERFGTQLVVVLGHSHCGAILATLEELEHPAKNRSPNLRSILDSIRPAIKSTRDAGLADNREAQLQHAIHANIRASVNQLRQGSEVLKQLMRQNKLTIVAAEYSLETGLVDIIDAHQKARSA